MSEFAKTMDGFTRRNGDRAACEPCRKSKQRCDHGLPPCGRCTRRGLSAAQCYYHPNPMAQPQQRKAAARRASRTASVTPTPPPISRMTPQSSIAQTPDLDRATGLIGMQGSLSAFEGPADLGSSRKFTVLTSTGVALASMNAPISSTMLAEGIVVLEHLVALYRSHGELVRKRWSQKSRPTFTGNDTINRAACLVVDNVLQNMNNNLSHDAFATLAQALFDGTTRELRLPCSAAEGTFEAALSGENFRWETVALYIYNLGCWLASDSNDVSSAVKKMIETSYFMVVKIDHICERLGQVNDLTLWVLLYTTCLATWCFGDDSYYAWRTLSKAACTLSALNYQQGVRNKGSDCLFLIELRKRAVALCHEIDKQFAIFVGRPPQISRHYGPIELPLEIDDETILGPPEALEKTMAALDEHGWQPLGSPINEATRLRASILIALPREEALEILLSPNPISQLQTARAILTKVDTVWQTTPFARYTAHPHADFPALDDTDMSMMRWIRTEYLYNKFLLLKLLANQSESDHRAFIQVSHDILHNVLQLLRNRTDLIVRRADLEFTMVSHAMPTASVLLLELYRLSRQPNHPQILPRSTIIRDISALIACCDWFTESGQGNFTLCKRAQALFSRGLDQILDYPQPPPAVPSALQSRADTERNGVGAEDQNMAAPDINYNPPTDGFVDDPAWTAWLQSVGLDGVNGFDFLVNDFETRCDD